MCPCASTLAYLCLTQTLLEPQHPGPLPSDFHLGNINRKRTKLVFISPLSPYWVVVWQWSILLPAAKAHCPAGSVLGLQLSRHPLLASRWCLPATITDTDPFHLSLLVPLSLPVCLSRQLTVLVFYCFRNKLQQVLEFNTVQIGDIIILYVRCHWALIRMSAGLQFFLEALEETLCACLLQLPEATCIPWHMATSSPFKASDGGWILMSPLSDSLFCYLLLLFKVGPTQII